MLCQICQKRPATVHYTQIVDGKKVELYLCEQCANENSNKLNIMFPFNISNFFSGLVLPENESHYITSPTEDNICKTCGMSFNDFKDEGKLGCENCYEVYKDKLTPILKRLHGSTRHTGKVPGKLYKSIKVSKEIEILKQQLDEAIRKEEYEEAAKIRDKIKAIEKTA
jgi:protein arginine kinase activator